MVNFLHLLVHPLLLKLLLWMSQKMLLSLDCSCLHKIMYHKSVNIVCYKDIFVVNDSYGNQSYKNMCTLVTLTWYGVIPTKSFQHENLSYEVS